MLLASEYLNFLILLSIIFMVNVISGFQSYTFHRYAKILNEFELHSVPIKKESYWWETEDLYFKCTGCGKCCSNDGEVWLDLDEFVEVAESLKLEHDTFVNKFVAEIQSDWVKIVDKVDDNLSSPRIGQSCVFLADDSKTCTIYKHRPVQCRTYPYWPSLLASRSSWNNESVMPPEIKFQKHWTPESGGCEGIFLEHNVDAKVDPLVAYRNMILDKVYKDPFPFMKSGDDRNRLLAKSGVISKVIRSTKAWVNDFIIRYSLCPFAESVFSHDTVRYRVFLGTDKAKIIEKLKYEMLVLMTTPEEMLSTTLLVLPFAFPDFEEFYDYSLEVEDEVLPKLEKTTYLASSKIKDPFIQLAFFHNNFRWAGVEEDDPLNYEKRAPFTTINLLRASNMRDFFMQSKTQKISQQNEISLQQIGSEKLKEEFERLINLAL